MRTTYIDVNSTSMYSHQYSRRLIIFDIMNIKSGTMGRRGDTLTAFRIDRNVTFYSLIVISGMN